MKIPARIAERRAKEIRTWNNRIEAARSVEAAINAVQIRPADSPGRPSRHGHAQLKKLNLRVVVLADDIGLRTYRHAVGHDDCRGLESSAQPIIDRLPVVSRILVVALGHFEEAPFRVPRHGLRPIGGAV